MSTAWAVVRSTTSMSSTACGPVTWPSSRSTPRGPCEPPVIMNREPTGRGPMNSSTEPPTLFDWAGGTEALGRLTEAFYAEVRNDDVLGPVFRGMDEHHPAYVAQWLAEVFGG